jgi:hypothetical protein
MLKFIPPAPFDRSAPEEPLRARSEREQDVLGEVWKLVRGGVPNYVNEGRTSRGVCEACGELVGVIEYQTRAGVRRIHTHTCKGAA